ncbi:MAG: TonB-dependent receptor [Myxococcaceae bacterium]|nr:TonB-dependent receptor [Myxococcaceae bacterium]
MRASSRWSRALGVVAALVLLFACTAVARADDEAARAQSRTLFTSGATALDDGRPGDALAYFQRAYGLYPHYATLYNIGLCQRALGRTVESVTAFMKFLDVGADAVSPEQRATATRLIKEGQAKIVLATIKVTPSSAKIQVDGKPLEGREVLLDPGSHVVDATAGGRQPVHHAFTAEPGSRPVINLTMPRDEEPATTPVVVEPPVVEGEKPPPPPPPSTPSGETSRFTTTFWIASGVTAAALVTAGITGGIALSDSSAYNDPRTSDADAASRKSRGETLRVVADVSLGVAVIGTVVAIVIVTRSPDPAATSPAKSKGVTLLPGASPHGGSLDLRLRF